MNSDANRRNLLERDHRLLERMQHNHPFVGPTTSQNILISSILNPSLPLSSSIDERARMMSITREENNVHGEVVRIILSGNYQYLRPNSGQTINVAGHNICIGFTEDEGYDECVWEWHGHIVLYEDKFEFRPEYFYGFYNEKLPKNAHGRWEKKGDDWNRGGDVGMIWVLGDGGSTRVLGRSIRMSSNL